MKSAYFSQCSCGINIDENKYPEEKELYTNPSLTLARTLTLSTGERISGHFTFSHCYDTMLLNFAYLNSPKNLGRAPGPRSEIDLKRKIKIAWKWRLKNKYAGNRSWRKYVSDHVDFKPNSLSPVHSVQITHCGLATDVICRNISESSWAVLVAFFLTHRQWDSVEPT